MSFGDLSILIFKKKKYENNSRFVNDKSYEHVKSQYDLLLLSWATQKCMIESGIFFKI
jgi:hypothetical protein